MVGLIYFGWVWFRLVLVWIWLGYFGFGLSLVWISLVLSLFVQFGFALFNWVNFNFGFKILFFNIFYLCALWIWLREKLSVTDYPKEISSV